MTAGSWPAIETVREHENLLWRIVQAQAPHKPTISSARDFDDALARLEAICEAAQALADKVSEVAPWWEDDPRSPHLALREALALARGE